jgi:hypothetical protein
MLARYPLAPLYPGLLLGSGDLRKPASPGQLLMARLPRRRFLSLRKLLRLALFLCLAGDLVSKSKQPVEVEIVELEPNTVDCEEDKTIDLIMFKEAESNFNSDNGKEVLASKQPIESAGDVSQGMIENGPAMMKEALVEGDVGDKIDNNYHTNCEDENLDGSIGDDAAEKNVFLLLDNSGPLVKKELEESKQVFLKSEAGVERPGAEVFVKEEVTDTIDDQIKTSIVDDTADGVIGDPNNHGSQESSPKESTNHEEFKKLSPANAPILSLPKFLTDQTSTGTLSQQLNAQFAITSLDLPAGTKALLHFDRLLLSDQAMSVQEGLTEQVVRVNARRVEGFEEFDYQVICQQN